jgi:hypothetical protein
MHQRHPRTRPVILKGPGVTGTGELDRLGERDAVVMLVVVPAPPVLRVTLRSASSRGFSALSKPRIS